MGLDIKTLAAAKTYVTQTLVGEGAIKGNPGKDGLDGVGISNIEKISTIGLVDTYRITLSDNTTYDFTVTNGKDATESDLNNIEIIQGTL